MGKKLSGNEKKKAALGAGVLVAVYLDVAYQYHKGIGAPGTAYGPLAWGQALKWPVRVKSDYQALATTPGAFLKLILLGQKGP